MQNNIALPKISIVIPNYNYGQYIERAISSVLNQNYSNFECIVIDGASSDNSIEIIKKFADRLTYWVSEKDRGQSSAINKGFSVARGEIINWLCSDDYLAENAFQAIGEFFLRNQRSSVVMGNVVYKNEHNQIINNRLVRNFSRSELIRKWNGAYKQFNLPQPGIFIRKKILNEVGYLDENCHLCMDYEWYLRINKKHSFSIISNTLAYAILHKKSKSISLRKQQEIDSLDVSRRYWSENYLYYFLSYYLWLIVSSKIVKRLIASIKKILVKYNILTFN